jgi:DnaJ family protein C protein 13
VLTHLLSALSRAGGPAEPAAALSRELVSLWADEYAPALGLLKRIFPPGLMRFLNQRRPQPQAQSQAPTQQATAAVVPLTAAAPSASAATGPASPAASGAQGVRQPQAVEARLPAVEQAAMPAPAQQQQQQPANGQSPAGPGQLGVGTAGGPVTQQPAQQAQQAGSPLEQRYLEPQPPPRPGDLSCCLPACLPACLPPDMLPPPSCLLDEPLPVHGTPSATDCI